MNRRRTLSVSHTSRFFPVTSYIVGNVIDLKSEDLLGQILKQASTISNLAIQQKTFFDEDEAIGSVKLLIEHWEKENRDVDVPIFVVREYKIEKIIYCGSPHDLEDLRAYRNNKNKKKNCTIL